MRLFVSYSRRDNSLQRLLQVRDFLATADHAYIDDLEVHDPHEDRAQAVVNALECADAFVAVQSSNYLRTPWTRWEFNVALGRNMGVAALLPSWQLAPLGSSEWPWPQELKNDKPAPPKGYLTSPPPAILR